MDFCVEHLPYFAVPRYVEVMESLPMNPTGKVLKTELRESGVTVVDLGPGEGRLHPSAAKTCRRNLTSVLLAQHGFCHLPHGVAG